MKANRVFLDTTSRFYRKRLKGFLQNGYKKGEFHYVRGGNSRQELILNEKED